MSNFQMHGRGRHRGPRLSASLAAIAMIVGASVAAHHGLPQFAAAIEVTGDYEHLDVGIDSNEEADEDMLSISHPPTFSDSMARLKEASRRLRGNKPDPAAVVDEVTDVAKGHLEHIQSMKKMYLHGDTKALASSMKASMGDVGSSVQAGRELSKSIRGREVDFLDMGMGDLSLDSDATTPNLDDIPDSQIVQFFHPQAYDALSENLQGMVDILDGIDLTPYSPAARPRKLVDEPFRRKRNSRRDSGSSKYGSSQEQFQFHRQFNNFYPRNGGIPNFGKALKGARGRLPRLGNLMNDAASESNRRLKVEERHRRRTQDLAVCQVPCEHDDKSCNCGRLVDCVTAMTDYDLALLFTRGFIVTDPESDNFAKFSVEDVTDLNLFDADFDILAKIDRIKDLANASSDLDTCSKLLSELHSACDPSKESCSEMNDRSFQLSVEDVCDAVNNPTKLLLSMMSEELDGYASDDGLPTSTTTCGSKRLAFQSCQDFAHEFDYLYEGRPISDYPHPNPMRKDPEEPVKDSDFINFPLSYKIKRTVHGVDEIDFKETSSSVRVLSNMNKCMDTPDGSNIHMADCQEKNGNQHFSYDPNTREIKHGNGKCLDYNPGTNEIYLGNCLEVSNQQWFYDSYSSELKTLYDSKCMDWTGESGNDIYMNGCNDQNNQKFIIPQNWQPAISIQKVRVVSDLNKCMYTSDGRNVNMADCEFNNANQDFTYDPSTREIKHDGNGKCLDYNPDDNDVYLGNCLDVSNQKWFYDSDKNELKTFSGKKCLDWAGVDGNNLYMHDCHGGNNQKFIIPYSWQPALSSSNFEEIRGIENPEKCMESDNGNAKMTDCDKTSKSQKFYYHAETRAIKYGDKCLDYSPAEDDNDNVYFADCHGELNQQWYYESSGHVLNLYNDMCLDWNTAGGDNLYMHDCLDTPNQKFLIPSLWLPGIYMEDVRVFSDRNMCLDAHPDQNNNVHMAECQDGNTNQDFYYDAATQEIKHGGLCLDHNPNNNVWMAGCHGGTNQKWRYDKTTNRLQSVKGYAETKCLDWNMEDNVYMIACGDQQNQKFIVPSRWMPAIGTGQPQGNNNEVQVSKSYTLRPIREEVWVEDLCAVGMLQSVIDTCDESMALLLGYVTSLGTLRAIAEEVNQKGPERMPGTCCLDDPTNSQHFGYYYDPSSMECQNRGPWHLGITNEACENAGGNWFRSPCVTLKECIDDRDKSSKTFETFALDQVIDDPSDQERCSQVREHLGFDRDHPFDVEVCDEFHEMQCNSFFDEIDGITDVEFSDSNTTRIKYEKIVYPDDPALSYDILPEHEGFEKITEFAPEDQLGTLQVWTLALENIVALWDRTAEMMGMIISAFCDATPEIVAGLICVSVPARPICKIAQATWALIVYIAATVADIAYHAVATTYDIQTLSPGREMDVYTYVQSIYNNFENFDDWSQQSLNIINKNIFTQHTEMRGHLQDRHEEMVNDVNQWTADVGCLIINGLGGACTTERRLEDGKPRLGLNIEWPDGKNNLLEAVQDNSNLEELKKLTGVGVKLGVLNAKNTVGSCDSAERRLLSSGAGDNSGSEDESHNLLVTFMEEIDGKLDGLEEKRKENKAEIEHKVHALKDSMKTMEGNVMTIEAKVGAIEGKVDVLMGMIAQLMDQNKKLIEMKDEVLNE